MKQYQLVLVLKTSLSESARKKFLESLKTFLKDVKFTKEEEWGEKVLSYPIKKQTSGYYRNFVFETKSDLPAGLDKKLTNDEDVLRFLLLRQ